MQGLRKEKSKSYGANIKILQKSKAEGGKVYIYIEYFYKVEAKFIVWNNRALIIVMTSLDEWLKS